MNKTRKNFKGGKYHITKYTYARAKQFGVTVKQSTNKLKKIDVFKDNKKIASVGGIGYLDYPTRLVLEQQGKLKKGTAKDRRRLYRIRHHNDRNVPNSNGFYADRLLW